MVAVLVVFVAFIFISIPCHSEGKKSAKWSYKESDLYGPSNWFRLFPLCNHVKQSPILIDPNDFDEEMNCTDTIQWTADDKIYNWSISHNDHTILAKSKRATKRVRIIDTFQGGNSLHSQYIFDHFHVHWGPESRNGSEHIIKNNISTFFEAHFVHFSDVYNGSKAAIDAWSESNDTNTLAVIGVLFHETTGLNDEYNTKADSILLQLASNQNMDAVWRNKSDEAFLSFAISDIVNISEVSSGFYHYNGSLTTPPCTPSVAWFLAKNPIKVRQSTMDLFRKKTKLWSEATGAIDADSNFRPIQSNPSCVRTCNVQCCNDDYVESIDWVHWGYLAGISLFGLVIISYAAVLTCKKTKKKRNPANSKSELSKSINEITASKPIVNHKSCLLPKYK